MSNVDANNRGKGWLWKCFPCENNLRMNTKLEVKWDNICQQCCIQSTKVLRERIDATDIDQNQIRTVQYLLINKLEEIEKMQVKSEEDELPDLFDEKYSEENEPVSDLHSDVDRTPRNFNPEWDEVRLPPHRPQCGKCGGNLQRWRDVMKCRDCGEEEFVL
mgnify:CR=1 FL=1